MPLNSRSQMVAMIQNKAGVMLRDGRVVTRLEDLPSEAELAAWDRDVADKAAEQAALLAGRVGNDPNATAAQKDQADRRILAAEQAREDAERRQAEATATLQAQIDKLQADLAALKAPAPAAPAAGPRPVVAPTPAPAPAPAKAPEKK